MSPLGTDTGARARDGLELGPEIGPSACSGQGPVTRNLQCRWRVMLPSLQMCPEQMPQHLHDHAGWLAHSGGGSLLLRASSQQLTTSRLQWPVGIAGATDHLPDRASWLAHWSKGTALYSRVQQRLTPPLAGASGVTTRTSNRQVQRGAALHDRRRSSERRT